MKVLKFGGTSVGTVESLRNVQSIVDSLAEPGVVVVSALGGLTDGLIATARMAAAGDEGYRTNMRQMAQRHFDIIQALVRPERRSDVRRMVGEFLSQLEDIYTGVSLIGDLPEKVLNRIVSFGERMSSIMVANMLKDAEHADPLDFIKTKKEYGKNRLSAQHTEELIRQRFPLPLQRTVVTGGFISRDIYTGEITNLGRGGSDFTAALIAGALGAELLEIWTDVDGFMTADPRIVSDSRVIDCMSYDESTLLCEYGAKVIYPPTIAPARNRNIPMRVLNTHNPSAPGTLIGASAQTCGDYSGLSSMKDVALLELWGPEVPHIKTGAINESLTKHGLDLLPFEQRRGDTLLLAVADKNSAQAGEVIRDDLDMVFQSGDISELNITGGCTMITVVGRKMADMNGETARIVDTLTNNGVKVLAVDADEFSRYGDIGRMSVIVSAAQGAEALKIMHAFCFSPGSPVS